MGATPYVDTGLDPYGSYDYQADTTLSSPARQAKAQAVLERHRQLKATKAPWLYNYQLLGEFVRTRKQDFTIHITPGQFLTGKVFDSTAPMANHFMSSALLGALWPNGSRSFHIHPSHSIPENQRNSKEVKEYFERVTHTMAEVMDDPKCGLLLALEEYMEDQGAFGTSGVLVKENEELGSETPLQYVAIDAKKATIAEGADGFVDTVYIELEMTIRQVVQEYGIENVSRSTSEGYLRGQRQEEIIRILHAVEPRLDASVDGAFGNASYPIASIHIEIDSGHILKESGYKKMPVFITRFWKTMGEVYGRSPAMEAIPDILEVNEMREASIVAVEKLLNPPLVVLSDGSIGNQIINTSAGAISVHNVSGRIANSGQKPIEPLVTVGELKDTYLEIERLQKIIENNFFKDRLTDLNNDSRMTLGEANIRNQLRGQSLGTIYSRQIAELFSRLVERTFDILYQQHRLGVKRGSPEALILEQLTPGNVWYIPDAVVQSIQADGGSYKIRFISPAARTLRAEELTGIQQSLTAIANMSKVAPDIMDNVNTDKAAELIVELTGAPTSILHAADTRDELRTRRAQAQQRQADSAQREQSALIAKHTGQAAEAATKAGLPIEALFGDQNQQVA